MSRHLERDLESIERELLALSAIVEEMIAQACVALVSRQTDLAASVIETDGKVDQKEVKIEEDCLKILALHQPVASDLRRTASVLKINNDLERIGDLAVNIAQTVPTVAAVPGLPLPKTLEKLSIAARSMVGASLDAFVQLNVQAAMEVCRRDDEVDQLQRQVEQELTQALQRDPGQSAILLQLAHVAQSLERIADHATNIAEDAIYLVRGEITRHRRSGSPELVSPS